MAGDFLREVKAGDPLKIPADAYNAMIRAARWVAFNTKGAQRGISQDIFDATTCLVRNSSGADRSRFHVLGVDSVLITPTDNLNEWAAQFALDGITPTTTHNDKFVILLEPISEDQVGRAVASGLAHVKINVSNAAHSRATVDAGNATRLTSAASGGVPIIWKESGTGEKYAIVRLDTGGGTGGAQIVRFTIATTDPLTGTVTAVICEGADVSVGDAITLVDALDCLTVDVGLRGYACKLDAGDGYCDWEIISLCCP
jgi:hypothetical protein